MLRLLYIFLSCLRKIDYICHNFILSRPNQGRWSSKGICIRFWSKISKLSQNMLTIIEWITNISKIWISIQRNIFPQCQLQIPNEHSLKITLWLGKVYFSQYRLITQDKVSDFLIWPLFTVNKVNNSELVGNVFLEPLEKYIY